MDRQAFFEKSARHLLTQMRQSIREGMCVYRGDNGCRCALGPHIPDALYQPAFEGVAPEGPPGSRFDYANKDKVRARALTEVMGLETEEDCAFARSLQEIHDRYTPDWWFFKLRKFAVNHGLDGAFLKDATVA